MPSGAMTLIESAKTMDSPEKEAIINTYAASYHPMMKMQFLPAPAGSISWTIRNTLAYTSGGTRLVNGSWTATRGNKSPFTETFKIYGGEIKIDRAIIATNPGIVAEEKEDQIQAKALNFTKHIFEGVGGQYLRGIKDLLDNEQIFTNQTVDVGTASGGSMLQTDHLDQLLNVMNVEMGNTVIYCTDNIGLRSRKLARGNSASGDTGYNLNFSPLEWGFFAGYYNGVPIIPLKDGQGTDLLSTDEGDGSSCSVYAVTFGTKNFTGFQVQPPTVTPLNQADVYDYFDFEHYVGTAAKSIKCIGRLRYVTDAQ